MVVSPGRESFVVAKEQQARTDDHDGPRPNTAGNDVFEQYEIDDYGGLEWIMMAIKEHESMESGRWRD